MIRIGVIGQSGEVTAEVAALSAEIGQEIASRGAILLTGGTNGVMEAALKLLNRRIPNGTYVTYARRRRLTKTIAGRSLPFGL